MTHPIVEEIHRFREQLWLECHENDQEFAQRLLKHQATLQDRLIDPETWRKMHQPNTSAKHSNE